MPVSGGCVPMRGSGPEQATMRSAAWESPGLASQSVATFGCGLDGTGVCTGIAASGGSEEQQAAGSCVCSGSSSQQHEQQSAAAAGTPLRQVQTASGIRPAPAASNEVNTTAVHIRRMTLVCVGCFIAT